MRSRHERLSFKARCGLLLILLLLMVSLLYPGPGGMEPGAEQRLAERLESLFSSVADRVSPAVVAIATREKETLVVSEEDGGGLALTPAYESFGTGFIIDSKGYILTNHHLVRDSSKIVVRLFDQREFNAVRVHGDPASDIAVLKINAADLPTVRFGDSATLKVGQWVLAIGNPFGLTQTVSVGIVSALRRKDLRILPQESFIQTDASINPGNSGGPLVNLRGEVVGMNTAIYSATGHSYHGIGFAVPINLAKVTAKRWMEGKSVSYFGVLAARVDREMMEYFGLDNDRGAFVQRVEPDSPAAAAGVRPMDVILRFAGKEVRDENHLRVLVARQTPEETTEVVVHRKSQRETLRVTLRAGASKPAVVAAESGVSDARLLGITLAKLSDELALQLGLRPGTKGVAVIDVDPQSTGWRKGLRQGDVIVSMNELTVHDLHDVRKALVKSRENMVFHVFRGSVDLGFVFLSRR